MKCLPVLLALVACSNPPEASRSRADVPTVVTDPCGEFEICDGIDNDCDGEVDEGLVGTWYADEDGDGIGGDAVVRGCNQPFGYSEQTGDCDDGNSGSHPLADEICDGEDNDCDGVTDVDSVDEIAFHPDVDGDGFGDPGITEIGCTSPPGWVATTGDCDDLDPVVHPDAAEACNQLDDNCDGLVPDDEFDWDFDGFNGCGGDCDDTDIEVAPGQFEQVYDGVDNDCDPLTLDDDLDGDGYGHADDCDDTDPAINPDNAPPITFVDVTVAAGLFATQWEPSLYPGLCGYEIIAGGVAAADYNGDGYVDLYLPVLYDKDRLYQNQGDGTFVDVAVASGIDHDGAPTSGVWIDIEGDGDLDLYTVEIGIAPARLYVNDGAGFFAEEAVPRGVDMGLPPVGCAYNYSVSAADADGDGDVDLFTNQWQIHRDFLGDRNRLMINDGAGFFTDGTAAAGIVMADRAAFSSSFGDVDGDGILDIAVAADWGESGLWMGRGGGLYVEETLSRGVGYDENGMGSDLADFDQDGDLDWFVTAIYDDRPCGPSWGCLGNWLYVNDGNGVFHDGTQQAGLQDGSWAWGAAFLDVDNDGDLDVAHTNGFPSDPQFVDAPLRLFLNDGAGHFEDGACAAQLDLHADGRALIPIDFDNDGDLDIFTTVNGQSPRLFENVSTVGSWLRVVLDDGLAPGNQSALGAIVEIEAIAGGVVRRRDVHANNNFSATRPAEVHFGFGAHAGPLYEVRVTWPDGAQTTHAGVAIDQIITLSR